MNIAIIIFVISVIVTIVSAISDNSHKDRKNQKPPINNQPNRNDQPPKRGGFLDEIGKAFKEIEQQMNEGPTRKDIEQQPQKRAEPARPVETRAEKMETPNPQQTTRTMRTDNETEAEKLKRSQEQKEDKLQKELEADLMGELQDVRTEIDRENEKKLKRTERRARAIISDKYLSERTKRFRLKQLMDAQAIQSPVTNEKYRFAEDEVVNGIIWSEILEKPKRL
ncbi:hypothetical protein [Staphylococcus parequorum]|uniref:hypothetical protein n=1 Tax=unclassified Staphylococcus TaxID=91994 RepID=UPI003A829108